MKKRILAFGLILALVLSLCPLGLADYEPMTPGEGCVDYIKKHEGFMSRPYSDGTGWYIGYGCACDPADYPEPITEEEATDLLWDKLDSFSDSVNKFLKKYDISVTQGQFDALCSMTYNFGPAWLNVSNRLPRFLAEGVENYTEQEIVSAFAAWCHIGSTVSEGLLNRRIMEAKMFLYEDYSFTTDGWCYLITDAGEGEMDSDVYCYEEGERYGELPTATREGYTLAGWETEEGEVLSERDRVKDSFRVSAVWVKGEALPDDEEAPGEEQPEEDAEESEEPAEIRKPEHVDEGKIFPDFTTGAWYYDYVRELTEREVINGYEDGTFRPGNEVSWGQALKLILLAAGYEVPESEEKGHWAQMYMDYAVEKGFMGESDVPGLDKPIDRNAIADLAAAALELDFTWGNSPYADSDRYSVLALTKIGVVEGSIEDGLRFYKGNESITRAEISAIVWRIADYVDRTLILFRGHRIPINHDLATNPYDPEAFTVKNGRTYYNDPAYDVRYGVDVSYYQKNIDWQAVANDGIDYAIIRAGYRGCSEGALNTDERYYENIRGARDAGLDVGVYFFSQALTVEEAVEEAEYVLSLIEGYDITYPVAFDWEPLNYSYSRTRSVDYSTGFLTEAALAFCETIENAGYKTMIYMNPSFAYLRYDLEQLQDETIWLAYYQPENDFYYDYHMWQYGSTGNVDGIGGWVDMNISFYDLAQ